MKSITYKNKNNTKKKVFLICGLILLITTAGLIYYVFQSSNSSNPSTPGASNNSSNEDSSQNDDVKGIEQPETLPDNSQTITPEDVPVNTSASAQITRLEQINSTVHFSAKITGTTEMGRCVVAFSTPNDRPVTKEFNATKSSSDYVCAVDTSALEFSYLGQWNVTLRYYSADKQVTATGEITIS